MLCIGSSVSPKTSQDDFNQVWRANRHRIYRCCLKWLNGDQDKADDAMSLASEKALRYFQSEQEQVVNMYPWLCKLAYNICIDMHRFQARQHDIIQQVTSLPDEFYFSENSSELLEDKIARERILANLMQQLAILPDELKLVIKYRFLDEMDYCDIARQLNISPDNVRKRVQLARKNYVL